MVNQKFRGKEIILFLLIILMCGCATVSIPYMDESGYKIEEDELRLFKRSQEFIDAIDRSDYLYSDTELNAYLTRLARQLMPENLNHDEVEVTVRVLNEPSLNAFALPNGRIYVNLGILSSAENEAQIASLLAHEMTHILHRHELSRFRSLKNKSAFWSTISLPMAVAGGVAGSLANQLGYLSSISGYSKEQEIEADEAGFRMLVENNYDVREGKKMFENLRDFIENEDIKQPFFFSTHPGVRARIKNFGRLIDETHLDDYENRTVDTEEFESFIPQILKDQIELCLQIGYFKTAEKTAERYIADNPRRSIAYYYLGEVYRQRQDFNAKKEPDKREENLDKAIEEYDKAIELNATCSWAIKGKARVLWNRGLKEQAKVLYRRYLEVFPRAPDRAYIEQYINQ